MGTVVLTEKTVAELKRIMTEQNMDVEKVALRAKVVGCGCSGMETKLELDEEYDEAKDEVEIIDGVRVLIDKRSILYLAGATIDFHEDASKRGFIVNNPQEVKNKCGCGSSC